MIEILEDVRKIVQTIPLVNKVSHGKPLPIQLEDSFNSIYISLDSITYKPAKMGLCVDSYDRYLYIKLVVNTLNDKDELGWAVLHDDIIRTVLSDELILPRLIDRDVIASSFDEYGDYPKKSMEIMFEFRIRSDCT